MSGLSFPTRPDEVTPEWLGEVLSAPVTAVHAANLGEGVGVMAEVSRLHITCAEPGHPTSVIMKTVSPAAQNLETARDYGFYRREVRFYQDIAHTLRLRVPHCWFAAMDDSSVPFVIVLEDMAPARQIDQLAGCSLADAEAIVDAVAQLHARWWNAPDLADLDWLPPVNNDQYKSYQQVMPHLVPGLEAAYGDRLDPAGWAILERMGALYPAYLDWWLASGHVTFCHYDLRPDNILFPAEGPLCLLDWQLAVQHTGTFDLGYFLGQNVSPEFRREHQDALVRRYHDALVGLGVQGYSYDRCWDDYRRAMLMHIVSATQLAVLDGGNERGQRLLDAMLTSGWTAAVELDSAAFLDELAG